MGETEAVNLTRHALACAFVLLAVTARADNDVNWPEFRGPRGDGVSTSTGLPITWSETNHIKWKIAVRGRGWSSPVIWGNQVWVSSATTDGHELYAICIDRESGKIVRDEKLFDIAKPQYAIDFNTYASPTPVIEEGRIYVTFGSPGTACVDTKTGKILWDRKDIECNHYRGAGSSLMLDRGRLYLDFDGSDKQFVMALDAKTGKTIWRTDRSIDFRDLGPDGKPKRDGDFRKAYATCRIAMFDGVRQLLSQGANAMYAYDPDTGAELWRVEERTAQAAATRPVIGNGLVYVPSGFPIRGPGQILAIRPGKKGEWIDANSAEPAGSQLHIVWKAMKCVPRKPSLTLHDGLLFGIDDNGVASCWDAANGDVIWNERIGGNYSASPLLAEGHLYFFSEEGKATVVDASRQFQKVGENVLESGFMASPAVSGKALILRTKTHLYRIEN